MNKLALIRLAAGLSQKEVAAKLNVSQSVVSFFENGITRLSIDRCVKLAELYNVSEYEISQAYLNKKKCKKDN